MKDDLDEGGPVFPGEYAGVEGDRKSGSQKRAGMSLRDWFAGKALEGNLAFESLDGIGVDRTAEWAYRMADAMIVARKKPRS